MRLFDLLRDILESSAAINDLKTIILVLNYLTVLVHVYVYWNNYSHKCELLVVEILKREWSFSHVPFLFETGNIFV